MNNITLLYRWAIDQFRAPAYDLPGVKEAPVQMRMRWFAILFAALPVGAQMVHYNLPTMAGLDIIPATDRAAQAFVSAALGSPAKPEIVALLPYSVVLRNNTKQRVVAHALRASGVDSRGIPGGIVRSYYNFDTASNGQEIAPQSWHLVTPSVTLGDAATAGPFVSMGVGSSAPANVLQELSTKASVAVSVDLVVFEDGHVLGEDAGHALSSLKGGLTARHAIAEELRARISRGESPAEVTRFLSSFTVDRSSSIDAVRRHVQAKHFLMLPPGRLQAEIAKVLAKPAIPFDR